VSFNRLKAFLETEFSEKRLVIVSNREPYVHKKSVSGIKTERPAGGLTSAMDDVLRAVGGTWVAWGSGSADRETAPDDRVSVPPDNPAYTLRRVWLSAAEANNYYHGYSNHVLWPLCHMSLDKVYFMKRFWRDYERVNSKFAYAALDESDDDSIVWVHDYHLCLVPGMMREVRPAMTIVQFWHIPWPDWGVFRICPQAKELVEGLLACDLIGFQTPLFVENFLDCVKETVDAEIDPRRLTVTHKGYTTRLKVLPISVDYEKFNSMALSQKTVRGMEKLRKTHRIKGYLGVGVDRLEYTKGLIKRFQAIDLFFERYERFRTRFTFIQVAVPTRLKEPYLSYKRTVEELIARINRKYSRHGWKPVIYMDTKIEHKDLAAYYRLADVAIISSIYDGMNLVAKEYVASQVDKNGALILSELAGAAYELDGAILVNPYDVEGFASTIASALDMDDQERSNRMTLLRKQVRINDIHKWVADVLREMLTTSSMKDWQSRYLFDYLDEIKAVFEADEPFLFLDFDGTLSSIVSSPELAVISHETRKLVSELRERIPVAIISGRSLDDIREKVGLDGVVYAGNHGAEIWDGERTIINQHRSVNRALLDEFIERLKGALEHIPGAFVEDKGVTASVHFRNVSTQNLAEVFEIFTRTARDYENSFRTTSGKKVFEIRPLDIWNKGDAVEWISEKMDKDRLPVYVGDDTTDVDAYRAIKDRGVSVSIGVSPEADYYLKGQDEITRFLELIKNLTARHTHARRDWRGS